MEDNCQATQLATDLKVTTTENPFMMGYFYRVLEDNLLDEEDRLVDQLKVVPLPTSYLPPPHHPIYLICPRSLTVMQDYLSELPQEIVDWNPQLIFINTNVFSNSHRYILQQLSSCHEVTFIQETRFCSPSEHGKVEFHWQRITNHEGSLFFEPPIYPEVPTSPATGGLATLIYPHSPPGILQAHMGEIAFVQ
ncbi:hypothetical protein As57867_002884, partial [Aphanomyces stellatus]